MHRYRIGKYNMLCCQNILRVRADHEAFAGFVCGKGCPGSCQASTHNATRPQTCVLGENKYSKNKVTTVLLTPLILLVPESCRLCVPPFLQGVLADSANPECWNDLRSTVISTHQLLGVRAGLVSRAHGHEAQLAFKYGLNSLRRSLFFFNSHSH